MKTFQYKGFDREGYSQKGLVEAPDAKNARDKLARDGILAERLSAVGHEAAGWRPLRRSVFTANFRSLLYRELGALLSAGLPLVNALDVLIQSPELAEAHSILAEIRDRVREGMSFAQSLGEVGSSVRPFERAVIAVGEKSGTLDAVLVDVAEFMEEQQRVQERIQSALIYPVIVVIFAFVVAVVMLGFVIPKTGRLLEETHLALPLLTRVMMKLGRMVAWVAPLAVLLGVGGWAYVRDRLRRDPVFRRQADRRLFHLPLIGKGYSILVNLRFARTLCILLRGGVTIIDSLGMAGRATGSAWIEHRLDSETESIRHGGTLADAVRRVGPLSASLPGWIQTGEASGALEKMLNNAGDRYQRQWDRFVARRLSVLEPALILFVGVIVLLVALSVLLPVISMNRALM